MSVCHPCRAKMHPNLSFCGARFYVLAPRNWHFKSIWIPRSHLVGLFLAFLVEDNKSVCNYRIVTILEGGRVRIGFLTKCGGINRGDTPRVPKAPRGVPEVDPDTRGQENPISLSTDKSIVIILPVLSNHPKGWPLQYETSQGMFCQYG